MSDKNPPIPLNPKNVAPLTEDEGDEIVTLTDEEGQDHEFVLVDVLELNEQEYAILLPFAEVNAQGEVADGSEESAEMEAVILRIETDGGGDEQLVEIDDEQEWQSVVDAYEAMLEDGEGDDDEGDR